MTDSVSGSSDSQDTVCVGELKSAYGIKGWLWIYSHTDPMEQVFDYSPWSVKLANGEQSLSFSEWRKQGKGLVVKLDNVTDRTEAERYCHTKLYIDKSALPALDDDEHYWSDLEGMTIITNTGDVLGEIAYLSETAAHPIMHVQPTADSADNEARLIPWHRDTVMSVDKNSSQVVVDWALDY